MRQAVPERKAKASTLARRLRGSLVSFRPGGVGTPPGDTTIPCQELADVDVWSFAAADARLWNGADTGARSPRRLKARSNRTSAKCAARRRRCSSQLPTSRFRPELAENAAMERRKARPATVIGRSSPNGMDPLARRVTGCARFAHQRLRALHLPSLFSSGRKRRRRRPRATTSGRRSFGCLIEPEN
jgi:hypothetical protein